MKHNSVNFNYETQPWQNDEDNIGKIKLHVPTIMTFIREEYETCLDVDKEVGCKLKLFFWDQPYLWEKVSHVE
jgi:hypothetical protein